MCMHKQKTSGMRYGRRNTKKVKQKQVTENAQPNDVESKPLGQEKKAIVTK